MFSLPVSFNRLSTLLSGLLGFSFDFQGIGYARPMVLV